MWHHDAVAAVRRRGRLQEPVDRLLPTLLGNAGQGAPLELFVHDVRLPAGGLGGAWHLQTDKVGVEGDARVGSQRDEVVVAYDSRAHAQLGDITRPRPVAAQLLYARCRSSAAAEQALSALRRGQVQDAPKCARVRAIVVAAAAGAVLLRPVPWSDAALRQP